MKKKITSMILAILVCSCGISFLSACGDGDGAASTGGNGSVKKEFSSGSGTQNDPYIIGSDNQWVNISKHPDSSFELACNINLGDYESVRPVGDSDNPFTGTIDGKGFSVNSAKIVDDHSAGLFGVISGATIKNLGFSNSSVRLSSNFVDNDHLGSFVAIAKKGSLIENCYSDNVNVSFYAKTNKWARIGGFAGSIESMSSVICCSSNVKITQSNSYSYPAFFIGGFARLVSGASVDCCKATGSISFGNPAAINQMRIGTFVDRIINSTVTNMYADMTISAGSNIDVYYFMGRADYDSMSYCLNFSDYKATPKGRFEQCDLESDRTESVNIYFPASQYSSANSTLSSSQWADNKYWKAGRIHPELVTYDEYLKIKQSEQNQ